MTDLWTCPDCGRQFANRKQAHSCVTITLDEHLAVSPAAVELYEAVAAALRDCGEYRIHPQKTRIAFITTMTFASVRLAQRWVDLGLITPEPIEDNRIAKVDLYGPTSFASELRLRSIADVDADVREWLCIAYERGLQETLDTAAMVEPVTGLTLERLRVPLASTVVPHGDDLALALPRYAMDVFGAHPAVRVRIKGETLDGEITEDGALIVDVASLGLGEGDPVDVTLRADV